MLRHFIRALLERGHEVTTLATFPHKETHPNYTEILIDPPFNLYTAYPQESFFGNNYKSDFESVFMYFGMGTITTEYGLAHPKIQEFLKRKDLHFDLVINEQFFQESFYTFAHIYNAPLATISTLGHSDYMDRSMGLLTPWSHVPHQINLDWGDNMNFYQRSYNTFLCLFDMMARYFYYLPIQQKLLEKYIAPHFDRPLPTVYELEQSVALRLLNNHRSLSKPRPALPGMIDIAGVHIQQPKPLPDDLEQIIASAKNGVIYFSFGAFLQGSKMPADKKQMFLSAFEKINQTVLWKWEDESTIKVPKNVIIRKWMPQNDILAHPNVIMFISHGGLFGTTEAVNVGIPVLFIPFLGDQNRNAEKIRKAGFGKTIKFLSLTPELLVDNINELITNKTYAETAKRVSSVFRDNLVHPMNESMFWLEYIVRHKGAPHLISGAKKLNWAQYLLLDVFAFYFFVIFVTVYIVVKCVKALFKKIGSNNFERKAKDVHQNGDRYNGKKHS
jgi:glucuronosyltransferase